MGDSRAVLARRGGEQNSTIVVPLSFDHKPDNPDEIERIRNAGGYVEDGRVDGELAVSRCLGDYHFKNIQTVLDAGKLCNKENKGGLLSRFQNKQFHTTPTGMKSSLQKVSPVPEILVQNRDRDRDLFVICACDGIWDVQTSEEAVKTVADILAEGESNIGMVCEEVRTVSCV